MAYEDDRRELAAFITDGRWTKARLARWGVPWPPPKGWRQQLASEYELIGLRAPHERRPGDPKVQTTLDL